ncbi:MAG: hypothetical protein ABSB96_07575 [Gaiellaceae bacterium]
MHAYTLMLAGFRRHVRVLAALVLALAVVSTASAAGSLYKGKVKAGGTLSFRTTATSVVGFKASPTVPCNSYATGSSFLEVHYLPLQTKTPLKNGHFKITYKGPFSTHVTVTGTVKGASASGTLDLGYTKTSGTAIYACQCKSTWTAKKA